MPKLRVKLQKGDGDGGGNPVSALAANAAQPCPSRQPLLCAQVIRGRNDGSGEVNDRQNNERLPLVFGGMKARVSVGEINSVPNTEPMSNRTFAIHIMAGGRT